MGMNRHQEVGGDLHPLGRPRRARGVEQHGRVVSPTGRGRPVLARLAHGAPEIDIGGQGAGHGAGRRAVVTRHRDDPRGGRQRRGQTGAVLAVGADHGGAAVAQAEVDGVGAEAGEDGHVHRAGLPRADHCDQHLGHARHE